MPSKLIDPAELPTMTFGWGVIKPLVSEDNVSEAPDVSLMHVVLLPGQGHERHNHPDADEILYVLAGAGDQMVDDSATFPVRPGQAIWIPKGAFHSTVNTGWGADGPGSDLRARGGRAGAQDAARLRRGPGRRRAAAARVAARDGDPGRRPALPGPAGIADVGRCAPTSPASASQPRRLGVRSSGRLSRRRWT